MKKVATLVVMIGLVGVVHPAAAQERGKRYPKLSPYSAVRWKDSTPEVKVKGTWYELVAVNDTAARVTLIRP